MLKAVIFEQNWMNEEFPHDVDEAQHIRLIHFLFLYSLVDDLLDGRQFQKDLVLSFLWQVLFEHICLPSQGKLLYAIR